MNSFLGDWTSPQYYRDSDSRSSIMTEPESEILKNSLIHTSKKNYIPLNLKILFAIIFFSLVSAFSLENKYLSEFIFNLKSHLEN